MTRRDNGGGEDNFCSGVVLHVLICILYFRRKPNTAAGQCSVFGFRTKAVHYQSNTSKEDFKFYEHCLCRLKERVVWVLSRSSNESIG